MEMPAVGVRAVLLAMAIDGRLNGGRFGVLDRPARPDCHQAFEFEPVMRQHVPRECG
mgnify:CR=1 FL=1